MSNTVITAPRASTLIFGLVSGRSNGVWLLPANACPAIPLILTEAKVPFEFIDIDSQSLCLDVELVKARISKLHRPKIAGVVYVRSYGSAQTAAEDLLSLRAVLGSSALIIDDQCLGFPVLDWEQQPSHGADVALFSTGYSKVFDLGFGGYGIFFNQVDYNPPCIARDPAVFAQIMQQYKEAIAEDNPLYKSDGLRSPIKKWVTGGDGPDWLELKRDLQNRWQNVVEHKQKINSIYRQGLKEFSPLGDEYQNWRFNIYVNNPTAVLQALFENNLFASDHYFPSSRLWGDSSATVAMAIHKKIINLFNDKNFTLSQAEHAVEIIQKTAVKVS